ncbi:MAG: STAS domain-containing protein [Hydrogenophaga sp.]|nr:STAS domain-containing protein [Hydrogenophaga sp.]
MPAAALPAQLTLGTAVQAREQLAGALAQSEDQAVRLDAGALTQFDSSAIAVLLDLRRDLQSQGKQLVVENWPERLKALVGLYGVGELLHD